MNIHTFLFIKILHKLKFPLIDIYFRNIYHYNIDAGNSHSYRSFISAK